MDIDSLLIRAFILFLMDTFRVEIKMMTGVSTFLLAVGLCPCYLSNIVHG